MPPQAPAAPRRVDPRQEAAFLRELAATQSVSAAARNVGMSRQSACKLRTRLAGTPFALAWDVALAAPPRGAFRAWSVARSQWPISDLAH